MTAQLAPTPVFKAFDNNGEPLANGQLFSYAAGTSTPQATYVDSTQTTPNTNPVILNARGEANVWLDPTLSYKLILKDPAGNQIWSVDNIQGLAVFINNYLPTILTQSYLAAIFYPQTPAEITAGALPQNFQYPPGYVDRYASNANPGVTDMTFAIGSAVNVAAVTGANVQRVIFLANSYLLSSTIPIPAGVTIQGAGGNAGTGTNIIGNQVTGAAFDLGTSDVSLSYYPAIEDLAITLQQPNTSGVRFRSSALGFARNIFVFNGSPNALQQQVGFIIQGGTTASCFGNTLINCYAQYMHVGYIFIDLGVKSTNTQFISCSAFGQNAATPTADTTGIGIDFAGSNDGQQSVFVGGFLENFAKAVSFNSTLGVTFTGFYFAGNTLDIAWSGTDSYITFFGNPDLSGITQSGTMSATSAIYAGSSIIVNSATTGSSGATFTASNKPGSPGTAPSKWLPVSSGGNTYYIPMWL